jgi:2-methylaconitate cis-trans-isomerase PrpF
MKDCECYNACKKFNTHFIKATSPKFIDMLRITQYQVDTGQHKNALKLHKEVRLFTMKYIHTYIHTYIHIYIHRSNIHVSGIGYGISMNYKTTVNRVVIKSVALPV